VLLSGEAGIGKSRLTAALMERLESEPHTRLRCSPQHTDSALYPVIGQMERAAGLAHGDTTNGAMAGNCSGTCMSMRRLPGFRPNAVTSRSRVFGCAGGCPTRVAFSRAASRRASNLRRSA
jgi:hypothetical protein